LPIPGRDASSSTATRSSAAPATKASSRAPLQYLEAPEDEARYAVTLKVLGGSHVLSWISRLTVLVCEPRRRTRHRGTGKCIGARRYQRAQIEPWLATPDHRRLEPLISPMVHCPNVREICDAPLTWQAMSGHRQRNDGWEPRTIDAPASSSPVAHTRPPTRGEAW
jgi:hypothetical protein